MDGRSWKIVGGTTVALLLILVLGALAFIYSGAYNVAATEEHTALVRWVLETTQDRSIGARGADVGEAPPFDSTLVVAGFDGFRAMCVECHGAPGFDPDVNGQGLYPEPPELGEEAQEFTDSELFWITKNGIKFTGMPAFGPTHSDEDLWSLVAFMRELEEMTPEEYQQRVTRREAELEASGEDTGGHTHAPGTPEHDH